MGFVIEGKSVLRCGDGGSRASTLCALFSLVRTWLFVGVVSCGVIFCGPSSSEDESSSRLSSCSRSCLSFSRAASNSAR